MSKYEIVPIRVGEIRNIDKNKIVMGAPGSEKINIPVLVFLIIGNGRCILVDTGPSDPDLAQKYHYNFAKTENEKIVNALASKGVTPADIDYIILTHMHWDHCYNMEHFPGKKIYVQKKEVFYALDPLPPHELPYECPRLGIPSPWLNYIYQFELLDGDKEIVEGIKAVHLPGHTPGLQGVLVDTEKGKYLIAGDCVQLYENWAGNDNSRHIPSGVSGNLFEYYATLDRIESFNATIIPGHDYAVLEHERYPY